MFRVWTIPILIALSFAHGAARGTDDAHPPGDQKAHPPAVYEATHHDAEGKHRHTTFDMSKPADRGKLAELVDHGHVLELQNTTAPTLDKMFSLSADLMIWTLVIFGMLLYVLSRSAWPKLIGGMQKREDNIRGALADAEKARDEAQTMRVALKKEMDEAHLQVKALIDEAKRDAQHSADEVLAKAKADIAADRERLRRDIQVETDQALQSLWNRAADLATQISAKAIRKQLDGDNHRRLIDEAIGELKKAGANAHA